MHKKLDRNIYKFDECTLCISSNENTNEERLRSPSCDRCQMTDEPDRFIPNFKTPREEQLEQVLELLCELKNVKDNDGETVLYKNMKPIAWLRAFNILEDK